MRDAYVAAALRAQLAGFDGVSIHAAFGWLISEFLSPTLNRRSDQYGGSLHNRARLLFEVIGGIRAHCRSDFQIGLRLSAGRYGVSWEETRDVAAEAMHQTEIDYIDLALRDAARQPVREADPATPSVLSLFTSLQRNGVRLGAAGGTTSAARAVELIEAGCDFVVIGRAAVLEPDFPRRVQTSACHQSPALPVTREFLCKAGISPALLNYLARGWNGFVAAEPE